MDPNSVADRARALQKGKFLVSEAVAEPIDNVDNSVSQERTTSQDFNMNRPTRGTCLHTRARIDTQRIRDTNRSGTSRRVNKELQLGKEPQWTDDTPEKGTPGYWTITNSQVTLNPPLTSLTALTGAEDREYHTLPQLTSTEGLRTPPPTGRSIGDSQPEPPENTDADIGIFKAI